MTKSKSRETVPARRLAGLADSPTARLARELANNPSFRIAQEFRGDVIEQVRRALGTSSLFQLHQRIEKAARVARISEQQRAALIAFREQAAAVERNLLASGTLNEIARLKREVSLVAHRLDGAFLPTANAIASLSSDLARTVEPFRAPLAAWENGLIARMSSLETAWVFSDHLGESMIGFARLSRLSDAAHDVEPYARPVSELIDEELGFGVDADAAEEPTARDAAAMENGLNPELIDFPAKAFGKVVLAAGFEFHFSGPPVPSALEAGDQGAVYDPIHNLVVTEVEQRLRQLVEERLLRIAGGRWVKQRVPGLVRKRWVERRDEEREAGRPVFGLVQYADFMDLADVICQGNNWSEVFEPIFRNREDFTISLRRLHPVRKALAHSRPLGRADVLTLVNESTRVLGALGVKVLG